MDWATWLIIATVIIFVSIGVVIAGIQGKRDRARNDRQCEAWSNWWKAQH